MLLISHFDGGLKRLDHAVVAVGKRIYSFGGVCHGFEYADQFTSMDVHVLNTTNFHWLKHPVSDLAYSERDDILPYKRFGHTAVKYGGKIYIWGGLNLLYGFQYHDTRGRNASTSDDSLFCFDTKSSRWTVPRTTGDIPLPRYGHTACIWQQYMYIYGGSGRDPLTYARHVYALDLDKMEWTKIITQGYAEPSPEPMLRIFHTAVCLGDRMYVYGGRSTTLRTGEDYYPDLLWYLDLLTNEWQPVIRLESTTPTARWSHSAFVYEEKMYIYGGFNPTDGEYYNDMYHFDPKTTSWNKVCCKGERPSRKQGQRCVVVKGRLFLVGGISTDRSHSTPPTTSKTHEVAADHNSDTYVVDFKPTLKTLCMVAVRKHKLDTSDLPLTLRTEMTDMFTPKKIIVSRPDNNIIR